MNTRWMNKNNGYDPVVVKWETNAAKFMQIEISPLHILRIRLDKSGKMKEGGQ